MTKTGNKRFQFSLCNCSQAFRAENFKAHLQTVKVKEELVANPTSHGTAKRVMFCQKHRCILQMTDDIHVQDHKDCPSPLHLLKKEMLGLFEGKLPQSKIEIDLDLSTSDDRSETSIAIENLMMAEEKEEEDKPPKKRARLSNHINEEEEESVLRSVGTSATIRENEEGEFVINSPIASIRNEDEKEEENDIEISQKSALEALNNMLNNMRAQRDRLLTESDELKAAKDITRRLEHQVVSLLGEKKAWQLKDLEREGEMERMKNEIEDVRRQKEQEREEKEKETQKRRILEVELVKFRAKASELELEAKKKGNTRKDRRIEAHLACRGGKIVASNIKEEDLDATMGCYENPSANVACHHLTILSCEDDTLSINVELRST